ncbi:MAG: DNA-binding protein WhiA [Actinobacteria bacterium]|nr:DNA-binding protein WhiA [Actinomycetota bacterium]
MGFTDRVRQELAGIRSASRSERVGQLVGLLHLGGSLHLRDGGLVLELATTSGGVARSGFVLAHEQLGPVRPHLEVHEPGGIHGTSRYVVVIDDGARELAEVVGVVDGDGRPRAAPAARLLSDSKAEKGFARGAVMAAASLSEPGRDPHLEVRVANRELAERTADALEVIGEQRPGVSPHGEGFRVVLKSGEAIGAVLAGLEASASFLEWDDALLRRHLRGEANRLANADAANLRRAVEAAAAQVRAVERAIARHGWDALDPSLREVALVRLANPDATLAEIADLCEPPTSKSTAHRRLQRLIEFADRDPETS